MKRLIIPVFLVALAGCSSVPDVQSLLAPYRIDVRQGNFVTPQMVAMLKQGQTRDQVRFILGTPLLTDPFHADRWDYVYRFQPGYGAVQQRHLAVHFVDGKLARFDGDIPADPSAPAAASSERVVEIGPKTGTPAPATGPDPARN